MRAVYEMRINIFELHNQDWSPHNLFEILENSASEARSFFGFDVKLNVKYDETVRQAQLPVPIIRELLMVCRECIANTAKHAGATIVEMHISVTPRVVTLSMQDNGHGFDPTRMNHRGNRGLSLLRQRVSRLNGELNITSQIGSGTTVQVEIPIT